MADGVAGRVQKAHLSNPVGRRDAGVDPSRLSPNLPVVRADLRRGRLSLPLPQLPCGHETGTDQFAPAPDQAAYAKHFTARGEGKTEQFGDCEVADFETGAILGNIDHVAFDPRRIRRRDQESGFAQVDPDMLARTEVFAVSRHDFPQTGNPGRKYLNTGYRKTPIALEGWRRGAVPCREAKRP